MRNFTIDELDQSDHFHMSAVVDCVHQIETESDHHAEYIRYLLDEYKSVHFLDVLGDKHDKLNNGFHDTLRNNINNPVHKSSKSEITNGGTNFAKNLNLSLGKIEETPIYNPA